MVGDVFDGLRVGAGLLADGMVGRIYDAGVKPAGPCQTTRKTTVGGAAIPVNTTIGRISQLTVYPVFPPQPPQRNHKTGWPDRKRRFSVWFGSRQPLIITANDVKIDPTDGCCVIADGVVIDVRWPITDIRS